MLETDRKMKSKWVIAIALFVILLATRIVEASRIFDGILLNVDEREMTFSVLDRFLGIPSTSLAWPGATLQFLGVPLIALDFIWQTATSISPDAFILYIAEMYRENSSAIFLIRCLSVLVFTAGFTTLYAVLANEVDHLQVAVVLIIMVTVPTIWRYSYMATGDALSLGFAASAVALLLRSPHHSFQLVGSGVLWGLAISSKVTILLLSPLLLALLCVYLPWRFLKNAALFIGATLFTFALTCPYAWIDPIRLTKSILGNASRSGVPLGIGNTLVEITSVFSVPIVILSVFGAWYTYKKPALFWGCLATFIFSVAIISRSGVAYDRYLLPLVVPLVVLSVHSFDLLTVWCKKNSNPPPRMFCHGFYLFIGAALLVVNVLFYNQMLLPFTHVRENLTDLTEAILQSEQNRVIIPKDYLFDFAPYVASESLEMLARNTEQHVIGGDSTRSFLSTQGLSQEVTSALYANFNEDEQAFIARLNIMSILDADQALLVQIYSTDMLIADRFNLFTEEEALALARNTHELSVVLIGTSNENMDVEQFDIQQFGQFTLVQSK